MAALMETILQSSAFWWAAGLAFLAVSCVTWGPAALAAAVNRARTRGAGPVRPETRALHQRIVVADLHCDSLLWRREVLRRKYRGHADVPRLIEGGVALQVFYAVTRVPPLANFDATVNVFDALVPLFLCQRRPPATWFSPRQRALHLAERLRGNAAASGGRLRLITGRDSLERHLAAREHKPACVGGLLGLEGLQCLGNDLAAVTQMFNAGYRLFGPAHFFDTAVGGSAHGLRKRGLTDFGREVVREIERLGGIIDLAHAAPALIDDVLDFAERPPLVSHTGLRGACATGRNLEDAQARRIAACGGLVGIGFWKDVLGAGTLDGLVAMLRYAVDTLGVDHVALGSDFDGGTVPPFDAAGLPRLTEALLDAGFAEPEVAAIMGGNVVRFFARWLPATAPPAS